MQEVIDYLKVDPKGVYLDLTFGRGGHTAALLDRLTAGRVIALDRDKSAIEAGHERFVNESGKLQLMCEKFSSISEIVREPVQGILADLGIRVTRLKMLTGVSAFKDRDHCE